MRPLGDISSYKWHYLRRDMTRYCIENGEIKDASKAIRLALEAQIQLELYLMARETGQSDRQLAYEKATHSLRALQDDMKRTVDSLPWFRMGIFAARQLWEPLQLRSFYKIAAAYRDIFRMWILSLIVDRYEVFKGGLYSPNVKDEPRR